jgi:mono/diheme cytochrome c family protein
MMTRLLALSALLFMTAGASYVAHAQEPGSPAKGLNYAQQVCALCHAVRKGDQTSPNPLAPNFEAIANTSGVSGISLATILHSTHENMPNFVLSGNEQDNIVAYILSLKHER